MQTLGLYLSCQSCRGTAWFIPVEDVLLELKHCVQGHLLYCDLPVQLANLLNMNIHLHARLPHNVIRVFYSKLIPKPLICNTYWC